MTSDGEARRTAGFVSRLLALAVDVLVLAAAGVGLTTTMKLMAALVAKFEVLDLFEPIARLPIAMLATVAYFLLSWTLVGQTVGMRALALRVVGPDERPPSPARALARLLGALIGALPLFAGYLLVLVDRRRLAFHDHVAATRVVYAGPRR